VGRRALSGKIAEPAGEPSLAGISSPPEDKAIHLIAQRAMSQTGGSTVVEVKGSHAVYVSQPNAVAAVIQAAADRERRQAVGIVSSPNANRRSRGPSGLRPND